VKAALDTNVLAYAKEVNGAQRRDAALALSFVVSHRREAVAPVQDLGELFNVLIREAKNHEPMHATRSQAGATPSRSSRRRST
jgi:predicted nucleic acid-binding protein